MMKNETFYIALPSIGNSVWSDQIVEQRLLLAFTEKEMYSAR